MSQSIQSCQIFHNPTHTLSFDIQLASVPMIPQVASRKSFKLKLTPVHGCVNQKGNLRLAHKDKVNNVHPQTKPFN